MAQRLGTVVHSCWHSASTLVGTVLGTLVGTVLGTLDHQNQPQILTVLDWLRWGFGGFRWRFWCFLRFSMAILVL